MRALSTPSLVLTPSVTTDRADFLALETDAEVMKFLHGGPVDHGRIDPATAPFLMQRGGEPHIWTARHAADARFIGWFSLSPGPAAAELGYRLRRDAWGRGFATEGAAALLAWGFEVALYQEVTATTMAVNAASRRVMEKLGMHHARTELLSFPEPLPGSELGDVTYGLRRADWFQSHPPAERA